MSSIRVSTSGELDALLEKLRDIENLDKRGIANSIAEELRKNTIERFEQERAPDGSKWKKSIRASYGGLTLTKSGALKNSISTRATAEGAEIGTNLVYAATHQFGTEGRTIRAKSAGGLVFKINGRYIRKQHVTVNIPARPFIGASEEDVQGIKDIVDEIMGEI